MFAANVDFKINLDIGNFVGPLCKGEKNFSIKNKFKVKVGSKYFHENSFGFT